MGFALHDFGRVTTAVQDYACVTGESPLPLGGWEVADAAICPPLWLVKRLRASKAQPEGYAYLKDFRQARAKAAYVFGTDIRFGGVPLTEEHVAVMPNSSQALLLALTAWREAGVRHVVVAAPCYYATLHICHHLGLDVTLVPAADYLTGALDLAAIMRALDQPHSALVVTNPAYSLGVTYGHAQLSALSAILPARSYLLLDETRLGLSWEDDAPWYSADYPPQTLVLRSPSKIFLLNGVKTSFLLGMPSLLRATERLGEALLGSVAGNAEDIALIYLAAWQEWRTEVSRVREGRFCEWRAGVVASLRRNLLACSTSMAEYGLISSPIDSGPYVLAALPRERWQCRDSADIARATGVMLMTSEYFYHEHPDWVGFRLNLCDNSDQAQAALRRVTTYALAPSCYCTMRG
ncbi:MAG TPA: pyridoxal phosphate-dependent aminotransferase [Ktedonobacterales bacterium]|nr:pyridoxal phosphate-dependent aminotransferase [Ktedonobacterales bacterium]